jgi:aspartyl aminopeptidase
MSEATSISLETFIRESRSPFHMVAYIRRHLLSLGYTELLESAAWPEPVPANAFVIREGQTIIAFTVRTTDSLVVSSASCDIPCFRPRSVSEFERNGQHYVVLEHPSKAAPAYQDMELAVVGSVFVNRSGRFTRQLIDSGRAIVFLPAAPSLKRGEIAPNSYPALVGQTPLRAVISGLCGCSEADVADWDLYFVPATSVRIDAGNVHASYLSVISRCYAVFSAFVSQAPGGRGTRAMALFGGSGVCWTAPATQFFGTIFESIFKGDYQKIKCKALNIVVRDIKKEELDQTNPLEAEIAVRAGARRDAPFDMAGGYHIARIANAAGIQVQVVSYGNDAFLPTSIAGRMVSSTGIRAVEVGFAMVRCASVREVAHEKDIAAMERLLSAAYADEGEGTDE